MAAEIPAKRATSRGLPLGLAGSFFRTDGPGCARRHGLWRCAWFRSWRIRPPWTRGRGKRSGTGFSCVRLQPQHANVVSRGPGFTILVGHQEGIGSRNGWDVARAFPCYWLYRRSVVAQAGGEKSGKAGLMSEFFGEPGAQRDRDSPPPRPFRSNAARAKISKVTIVDAGLPRKAEEKRLLDAAERPKAGQVGSFTRSKKNSAPKPARTRSTMSYLPRSGNACPDSSRSACNPFSQ